jgi:hypothetical protein
MGRPRFRALNPAATVFTVALLGVPLAALGAVPSPAGITVRQPG